jgi:hypothetical protein
MLKRAIFTSIFHPCYQGETICFLSSEVSCFLLCMLAGGSSSSSDAIGNFVRITVRQKLYVRFRVGMTGLQLYIERSEYSSYSPMIIVYRGGPTPMTFW